MRIAVLITGQPRHIEQGAWWFRNKVFPESYKNLEVDYFCHFWDDGSYGLQNRVYAAYNATEVIIEDYQPIINDHIINIKRENALKYTDWSRVPLYAQENHLFNTDAPTDWGRNYHGQFLSASRATNAFADKLATYDIIIKTRSDCILNPMDEKTWIDCFKNIYRNVNFRDTLFANWLFVRNGVPFHGDWVFVGKPEPWLRYGKNIETGLTKICTEYKYWFEETNETFGNEPVHWMWNRLNYFSKNNWLSFSVVWPMPFGCTVIREPDSVYDKTYREVDDLYWHHKRQQNS